MRGEGVTVGAHTTEWVTGIPHPAAIESWKLGDGKWRRGARYKASPPLLPVAIAAKGSKLSKLRSTWRAAGSIAA